MFRGPLTGLVLAACDVVGASVFMGAGEAES